MLSLKVIYNAFDQSDLTNFNLTVVLYIYIFVHMDLCISYSYCICFFSRIVTCKLGAPEEKGIKIKCPK